MMKFDELTKCPFCGCDEFYTKERAHGVLLYRERFDGEEAYNGELYDSLICSPVSGRVYCGNCGRVLGNKIKNTVTKTVETAIRNKDERNFYHAQIPME